MPIYRAYPVKKDCVAAAPSIAVVCVSDQDGIQKARKLVDGYDIELWDGPRFIARFETPPLTAPLL